MMDRRKALALLGGTAIGLPLVSAGGARAAGRVGRALTPVARRDVGRLRRHLSSLHAAAVAHGGDRAAGTAGYDASARYVEKVLRRTAFRVERQYFTYETLVEVRNVVEQVPAGSRDIRSAPAVGVSLSPAGGHTGELVVPDDEYGDAESSWEGRDVAGGIALLKLRHPGASRMRRERTGCHGDRGKAERLVVERRAGERLAEDFEETIRRQLSLAGAAGILAVVYDSGFQLAVGIQLGEPSDRALIPATCTVLEDADHLRREMSSGAVELHVELEVERREIETFNLLAGMPGSDSTHICGAHLDSVRGGPGMSDNGSGSAVLLETALKQAADRRTPWKFCWWGGEEDGMKGSFHFVDGIQESADFDRLEAYLNLDMVASPNYVVSVYGDDGLERLFTDHFRSVGQPWITGPVDTFSDHLPFREAGITVAGVDTVGGAVLRLKTEEEAALFGGTAGAPYDPQYHKAGDDLSNISWEAIAICAEAGDAACRTVAARPGARG
ncbi:M28 family peptidase [Streptomyces sp. NPDC056987]|uniref:M28 family peptidase n=1 Tax=Streptomyces sp. NPDC056987 TaxID=3345988 RepID=UPI0036311209